MFASGEIVMNDGLPIYELEVTNRASYTIGVSSHYHFFEANPTLSFEREKAWGMRLNIPTGSWIFFEPLQSKKIQLIPYSGGRIIFGNLAEGPCPLDSESQKRRAMKKAKELGYLDGGE
jgi:urease beta subunit